MPSSETSRTNKLLGNTLLLGIGAVFSKCLQLVMVVFYSSWLTAAEYGDYDLYVTYISLIIPIATLSCGEALFRFLLERESIKSRQQVISTAFAIVSGCVVLTLGILLIFAKQLFIEHLFQFVLLLVVEICCNLSQSIARGLHRLKLYAISSMLGAIVMAICTSFFIKVFDLGLNGMLYGNIVGYGASFLFCFIGLNVYRYINLKEVSSQEAKTIVKYSAPLIPNSIAWWIANGSDRTIIRYNLGSEYNGIYSIANKVPSICVTLFSVFHLSWQESASDAVREDVDPTPYFNSTFQAMIPTLMSIAIGVLSTNFFLFDYIFDPKYSEGYPHVAILVLATVFSFMSQFIGGIFIGLKKTDVNGLTTVIAALINIIVDLALIKFIGLYAASISTLVAYVVLFGIRFINVRRTYKISVGKKGYVYMMLLLYFCVMQYVRNPILNWINLVVAIVLFIYTNRAFVEKFLSKIINRRVKS